MENVTVQGRLGMLNMSDQQASFIDESIRYLYTISILCINILYNVFSHVFLQHLAIIIQLCFKATVFLQLQGLRLATVLYFSNS